jgi:hypothetical protein
VGAGRQCFCVIVSQEKGEGEFESTAYSRTQAGLSDWCFGKNLSKGKVLLNAFRDAIAEAESRLIALRRKTPDLFESASYNRAKYVDNPR